MKLKKRSNMVEGQRSIRCQSQRSESKITPSFSRLPRQPGRRGRARDGAGKTTSGIKSHAVSSRTRRVNTASDTTRLTSRIHIQMCFSLTSGHSRHTSVTPSLGGGGGGERRRGVQLPVSLQDVRGDLGRPGSTWNE